MQSEVLSKKERQVIDGYARTNSPTLILLVLLAALGSVSYLVFLFEPSHRGDFVPYLLVMMAETFIVFQALISMWTILAGNFNPRNFEYHDAQQHLFARHGSKARFKSLDAAQRSKVKRVPMYINNRIADVDIFITVYGEPIETIRETAIAARDVFGLHKTYILDDGKSNEVEQMAKEIGVEYIRRRGRNVGAKAGNINHALQITSGHYFVIFDADFVAKHNFLYETLPFFEDKNVAFVQTPQVYRELNNIISRGAGYMQRLFYLLIQPGKNRFNAAFCVGTNVIFRRSAIDSIGGVYQKSKSEDIWTSILLHEHGFRSVYIPDVLAIGNTPDTIKTYCKQQLRWATGGFQILFKHNPITKHLTIDQKLQYLSTSAYYLYGVAIMLLLLLPSLHVFFNWSPVNLDITFGAWASYYLAFYGMQIILAFYTMEGFKVESLLLGLVSFPIYVKALCNAIFNREEAWSATGSRNAIDSPFNYIVPQVMVFLFLGFTSAVGIWKAYYYETSSLSLIWCLINTFIFGSFIIIAWREHRALKRERKTAPVKSHINLTKAVIHE